jgi:ABC-type polysaccharide/polyol phosphate transport system ATPase subunit
MIELHNIGIKREDWVLRNVNLSIAQGELIGIIGESC